MDENTNNNNSDLQSSTPPPNTNNESSQSNFDTRSETNFAPPPSTIDSLSKPNLSPHPTEPDLTTGTTDPQLPDYMKVQEQDSQSNQLSSNNDGPTTPENITEKTTSHKLIYAVLAVIIMILLGTVMVMAIRIQNPPGDPVQTLQPQQTLTPFNTPTPIPSPTADPVADWETYTNNTFEVSVMHPKEWDTEGLNPGAVLIKPIGINAPQGEYQIPGVFFYMKLKGYDDAVQSAQQTYGSENQEAIFSAGMSGVHIWGTIQQGQTAGWEGGVYVLQDPEGNAFEFSYNIIDEQPDSEIVERIMKSIQLL